MPKRRRPYTPYGNVLMRFANPAPGSREGELLERTRAELAKCVLNGADRKLTAPEQIIIERAAFLTMKCAIFDAKIIAGTFTDYDSRVYLAFSNSLRRIMVTLGLAKRLEHNRPAPSIVLAPTPLEEYLASRPEAAPQAAAEPPPPQATLRPGNGASGSPRARK